MTRLRCFSLAVIALAAFLPAPAAFALPQCTHHDRLVQKINEAYHTQFQTTCNAPLDQPVEIIEPKSN